MREAVARKTSVRLWLVLLAGVALLMASATPAFAAITTSDLTAQSAEQVGQQLVGTGVNISNVSYTGANVAVGTFAGATGVLGFDEGIILSSGNIASVPGPNNTNSVTTANGRPGHPDLTLLAGYATYDAAILEFDFVPDGDTIYFEYVFASDEYDEWVGSGFNDVFAFYVNGTNYATVGDPPVPVSINTINGGYSSIPASHPELFRPNYYGSATLDTQMDGLTVTLVFQAPVVNGENNHLRLAIADASDLYWDSNVFIKAGSLSTTPPTNTAPTVAVDAASVTVDEGQTATNSGTVSDEDGNLASLTVDKGAITDNGDGTWSWSYDAKDDEAATVTVTATDSENESSTASFDLQVDNVAPVLGAISAPAAPVAVGTSVSFEAGFTDAGVLDTHTASCDFGDGTSSGGTISEASGSGTAGATHSYAFPGVYPVSVTVTDDDGDAATSVYEYVVVYDPAAGFVTGGGFLDSPAGAYVADPTLVGKASFGFVSKYKKGATVPEGATQFQFNTGDLNFHSNVQEWLVVNQNGANAQFKGSGTINGAGVYQFMIWAGDGKDSGDPDTFRIKIWSEAGDGIETVVYDNGIQQAIGGGSIVIHAK